MTTTTQAAGRVPGAAVGSLDLFHFPKARPSAGGWRILPLAAREADLGPTRLGRVTLDRMAIQRSLERRFVHHWREGRGRRMTGDVAPKLHTCADSLRMNRNEGRPVRAITRIPPREPEAEADARARRFPPAAAVRSHRFIPE